MITMITCCSADVGIIGTKGNHKLLWHLPSDMALFKKVTRGKVVVMGRSTFESLDSKVLPSRVNVVLTHKYLRPQANLVVCSTLSEILTKYPDFIVIGGEQIYNLFAPLADEIVITTHNMIFPDKGNYAYFPLDYIEDNFYQEETREYYEEYDKINKINCEVVTSLLVRIAPTQVH